MAPGFSACSGKGTDVALLAAFRNLAQHGSAVEQVSSPSTQVLQQAMKEAAAAVAAQHAAAATELAKVEAQKAEAMRAVELAQAEAQKAEAMRAVELAQAEAQKAGAMRAAELAQAEAQKAEAMNKADAMRATVLAQAEVQKAEAMRATELAQVEALKAQYETAAEAQRAESMKNMAAEQQRIVGPMFGGFQLWCSFWGQGGGSRAQRQQIRKRKRSRMENSIQKTGTTGGAAIPNKYTDGSYSTSVPSEVVTDFWTRCLVLVDPRHSRGHSRFRHQGFATPFPCPD